MPKIMPKTQKQFIESKMGDEFDKLWKGAFKIEGNNGEKVLYSLNYGHNEFKEFITTALKEIVEEQANVYDIESLKTFVKEGIDACVEDSKRDDLVGKELHYVFGKSQALKIVYQAIDQITSRHKEFLS